MAVTHQGSFGRIRVFNDFLGNNVSEVPTTTFINVGGNLGAISVSAANTSLTNTVDEPGGILGINTHTDDNDNCAIFAGVFKPADGGCVMETRLKIAAITTSYVFVGFMETLAVTTPVEPATYIGTTLAAAAGACVGLLHDADATTAWWRAIAADAAIEETVYSALTPPVADEWDTIRVEIGEDGKGSVYLNGNLVHTFTSFLTTTDIQHAVIFVENRSGATNLVEVDYFFAEGGRDWTV